MYLNSVRSERYHHTLNLFIDKAPHAREALESIVIEMNERTLRMVRTARTGISKSGLSEEAGATLLLLSRVAAGLNVSLDSIDSRRLCAGLSLIEATALAHLSASRLVYAFHCGVDTSDTLQDMQHKLVQVIDASGFSVAEVILSLPHSRLPARYVHDCKECTCLGQYKEYDLYFCNSTNAYPTLLARYGDEGFEYMTARLFDDQLEQFKEARARAKQFGLF